MKWMVFVCGLGLSSLVSSCVIAIGSSGCSVHSIEGSGVRATETRTTEPFTRVHVAGSTKLGNYVILAGQSGVAGHLEIGNKVTVAAQSGVMHNIPDGMTVLGSPALPDKQTKRQMLALQKLPELLRRVRLLEQKLGLKNGDESA